MANKDLFKQAIAEAKSIREAAIANAKEALEESLTPHLKDMLAAKLQEMEEADEADETVEETVEETTEESVEEVVAEEEDEADGSEEAEDDSEESEDEAEDEKEIKDMEVGDLKNLIRDLISQEMSAGEQEISGEEDMVPLDAAPEEEEIDLEELLSELAEMDSKEEDKYEGTSESEETNEADVNEVMDPQFLEMIQGLVGAGGIVASAAVITKVMDAAEDGKYGKTAKAFAEKLGALGSAAGQSLRSEETNEADVNEVMDPQFLEMIQGLIGAGGLVASSAVLTKVMDAAEDGKYGKTAKAFAEKLSALGSAAGQAMRSESEEALETVESLRQELSEVNLLNAKLLYVNKVFKSSNLSESQKVSIIAAFDKAETVKEVKLVFETVAENYGSSKQTVVKEHKGMASKATGTTASKPEIIAEVSDAVRRMQKLAGIIK